MAIDLMFVDDPLRQRLLIYLSIVDLLLHGRLPGRIVGKVIKNELVKLASIAFHRPKITSADSHLSDETVNVDWLGLTVSIHAENGLHVVGGVPRGVENDDAIRRHEIRSQGS